MDNYACIDKVIIIAARNRFLQTKDEKHRKIYIGGGYMIHAINNIY